MLATQRELTDQEIRCAFEEAAELNFGAKRYNFLDRWNVVLGNMGPEVPLTRLCSILEIQPQALRSIFGGPDLGDPLESYEELTCMTLCETSFAKLAVILKKRIKVFREKSQIIGTPLPPGDYYMFTVLPTGEIIDVVDNVDCLR